MHQFAYGFIAVLLLFGPVAAQETGEEEQEAAESEAAETAESSDTEDIDEQDYFELEQEDFDPSQDVVADQSLAFPTDI